MSLTFNQILKYSKMSYKVIGFNDGGVPEISTDNAEDGDIWLYFDIQEDLYNGEDLRFFYNELWEKLNAIWGAYAATISFIEDSMPFKRIVKIELKERFED